MFKKKPFFVCRFCIEFRGLCFFYAWFLRVFQPWTNWKKMRIGMTAFKKITYWLLALVYSLQKQNNLFKDAIGKFWDAMLVWRIKVAICIPMFLQNSLKIWGPASAFKNILFDIFLKIKLIKVFTTCVLKGVLKLRHGNITVFV